MTTEFEVGDLVCYGAEFTPYRVYGQRGRKILAVNTACDRIEIEAFPENLRPVYTFFDLCAAWEDADERCRTYAELGVVWEHVWNGNSTLWQMYVEYVRYNTPLPAQFADAYDYVTER